MKKIENQISAWGPKSVAAWAPATAAPAVFAAVLTMRMAAMGRSMLFLKLSSTGPAALPVWVSVRMKGRRTA